MEMTKHRSTFILRLAVKTFNLIVLHHALASVIITLYLVQLYQEFVLIHMKHYSVRMCIQVEFLNSHLFLSAKPVIYLVNLSERDYIRKKNKW